MNTERINGPEMLSSGVVLFPNVLDRFPTNLADAHVLTLNAIHQGYLIQKQLGFYPADLTEEEWARAVQLNDRLARNNTRVIRRSVLFMGEKLLAVPYTERSSGFRRTHRHIADSLDQVVAAAEGLPEVSLIRSQTQILAKGFRTGDTDRAMEEYINLRRLPRHAIGAFLQERILDKEKNLKFAYEGWSTEENRELSSDYNTWSRVVLHDFRRYGYTDFIFCDAGGQAGVATEIIWSGDTMPSQPEIGERYGHRIFFFDNVSAWKTARDVMMILREITPPEVFTKMEDGDTLDRVRRAVIAAHEVGHAAQVIPAGTDRRLGPWYQVLKETFADAFAPLALTKRPEIVIRRDEVLAAMYFDLARGITIINEYRQKVAQGNEKGNIIDPYPISHATKIQTLLCKGAYVTEAGRYRVTDLNRVRRASETYLRELNDKTVNGSQAEVEDFIMERSSALLAA